MLKNSQISVEYMVIMGFVAIITIPLIIIYYTFTQDSTEEIVSAQLSQIVNNVVDASESVYYLGEPSQTTLRVSIPGNLVLANLSGHEVLLRMRTKAGTADVIQSSPVNITGSLPIEKGIYTLTIKAKSNYVDVSYK